MPGYATIGFVLLCCWISLDRVWGQTHSHFSDTAEVVVQSSPAASFRDKYWMGVGGGQVTWLKPLPARAAGITTMVSDGATREDFQDLDFRFASGTGYRVWAGVESPYRFGLAVSHWEMGPTEATLEARPSANGFGSVEHPVLGNIDIGSNLPTDRLLAVNSLQARTSIGEGSMTWVDAIWLSKLSLGMEYSELMQGYQATLRNDTVGLVGELSNARKFQGVGPTLAVGGHLAVASRLGLMGTFRNSLLIGRSTTRLTAGEDLDLPQPFRSTSHSSQDTAVYRVQGELGVVVHVVNRERWQLDVQTTLEGQNWLGVGNSLQDEGNLGLFGVGLGMTASY